VRQIGQARENLAILEREIAPTLVDALAIAETGFAEGGTDYLLVLQTTSQYLDVQARILDQTAACQRAFAELERSVDCCLDGLPMEMSKPCCWRLPRQ
jgi:outer membrane protein TolC